MVRTESAWLLGAGWVCLSLGLLPPACTAQLLGTEVGAVPVGQAFPIAGGALRAIDGQPSIATDGTNFLISTYDGNEIDAVRVSPSGTILDQNEIVVDNSGGGSLFTASVAFDGTNYVLVWSAGEIYAARVSPAGTLLDTTPVQLTTGANAKLKPIALAFDGTNFLTAWRTGNDTIQATRFSPALVNLDAAGGFAVETASGNYYPWAAYGAGEYLIVWHTGGGGDPTEDPSCTAQNCNGNLAVVGARVSTSGTVLDATPIAISTDSGVLQDHASVAFDGTNFMAVWHNWISSDIHSNGSLWGARISPAGKVLDNPSFEIADKNLWEQPPNVTFDGTNYVVAWQQDNSPDKFRNADIFLTRVSTAGVVLDQKPSPVATFEGNQSSPRVAANNGTLLVAWDEGGSNNYRCAGCVYAQPMQEATNAGTAHASLSPTPVAANWTQVSSPVTIPLEAVFALDDNHAYTTGESDNDSGAGPPFATWNGSVWSQIGVTNGRDHQYGIWGASPDAIWTTGWCMDFLDFNGSSLSEIDCHTNGTGLAMWGSNPNAIFAVAGGANYFGYYNGLWSTPGQVPTWVDLAGIGGTSAINAYAVGEFGTILHFDASSGCLVCGSNWSIAPNIPTAQRLNAVWAAGPADIFAVGDFGTILHFNGTSWSTQTSGVAENLTGVWGYNGSDVYAVGANGRILHYDGSSWTAQQSPTTANLTSVYGAGHTVWAVGDSGTILQSTTAGNPTPWLGAMSPTWGGSELNATLTLHGANFVSGSTARWNGINLQTTYISSSELKAILPSTDLTTSAFPGAPMYPDGWGEITVANPAPQGGISSGLAFSISSANLSPSAFNFGWEPEKSAHSTIFTLTNSGFSALSLTGSGAGIGIAATPAGSFTQSNNCGSSLAINASCTIKVTFSPQALGPMTATLSVTDVAVGSPQTVSLTGSAVPQAPVFSVRSGTYAAAQTVAITDATAATAIHYTTDGATPTKSSPICKGALKVTGKETLKAIAVSSTGLASPLATASYDIQPVPVVHSLAATAIAAHAATLNGAVNPENGPVTWYFAWTSNKNLPIANGKLTAKKVIAAGAGSTAHTVSASISGLAPNTTYYFALIAVGKAGGPQIAHTLTFKTKP